MMKHERIVQAEFELYGYKVVVTYLEYSGGGDAHEFEVWKDGERLIATEDGHCSAFAAAARAFAWINDNSITQAAPDTSAGRDSA